MSPLINKYKVSRERVIEILNKYGYFTTKIFDDEWEQFARSFVGDETFIYLGNSQLDSDAYPICYDYRYTGCERGIESFIIGTYDDVQKNNGNP